MKVTNNNKLTDENILNILKLFENRKDVQYLCRLVPNSEISSNGYNMSTSSYVDKKDTHETIDINELNEKIERIVARENELREEINRIVNQIK